VELKKPYINGQTGAYEQKRDFLLISGPDALRFLQGMWTADIQLLSSRAGACTSAYLLDLKAKPISPAMVLCRSAEEFVLSVPETYGIKVYEALDKYLVADDVQMKIFEAHSPDSPFKVWTVFPENMEPPERVAARISQDKSQIFMARCQDSFCELPLLQLGPHHYELWLASDSDFKPSLRLLSENEIIALHIEWGRARWGVDYDENSFILEYPFEESISFYKGCYIGQEVVARGSFRGQVAKAFVRFTAQASLGLGYIYKENEFDKPVGKITSVAGTRALGQLRLREYETQKYVFRHESGDIVPLIQIEALHTRIAG
jgi:folate-binding protein YgfZ